MRIIFAGTPVFSAHILEYLLKTDHQVVAAYTQPDRRAGRGKKLLPTPVKSVALAAGIEVQQPLNFKDPDALATLRSYDADLMIVVAYGLLLPKTVLDTPQHGCINIHASLLPRWRGAAPIERAIEAGDSETGITMMQMDEGLDTGPMLHIVRCTIGPDCSGDELRTTLVDSAIEGTKQVLEQLDQKGLTPTVQPSEGVNYAHKLDKAEAAINWRLPATELHNRIRAFCSANVCYTELPDQQRVKIWRSSLISDSNTGKATGTILQSNQDGIQVQCGAGIIALQQLQLPGSKALGVRDILNGKGELFSPGTVLGASA